MEIFFLKKTEILKSVSDFDCVFKSKKRNIDYHIGRFLTKYIAKNFYNIPDIEIILVDKKPEFANSQIKFSISHSNEYVAVAFSTKELGLDIEKFKERNLEKLSKYFKKNFKSQDEFYEYWTNMEATYKSRITNGFKLNFKFKEYYVSVSSIEDNKNTVLYELINITPTSTLIEELKFEIKSFGKIFA